MKINDSKSQIPDFDRYLLDNLDNLFQFVY